jgi:hypothetical protein
VGFAPTYLVVGQPKIIRCPITMNAISIINNDVEDGHPDHVLGYITEADAYAIFQMLKIVPLENIDPDSFTPFGPDVQMNSNQTSKFANWLSELMTLRDKKISKIKVQVNMNVPLILRQASRNKLSISLIWD